eukprot:scaffold385_cov305-Pinguiococcus_pyrenoidosus.AAC.3
MVSNATPKPIKNKEDDKAQDHAVLGAEALRLAGVRRDGAAQDSIGDGTDCEEPTSFSAVGLQRSLEIGSQGGVQEAEASKGDGHCDAADDRRQVDDIEEPNPFLRVVLAVRLAAILQTLVVAGKESPMQAARDTPRVLPSARRRQNHHCHCQRQSDGHRHGKARKTEAEVLVHQAADGRAHDVAQAGEDLLRGQRFGQILRRAAQHGQRTDAGERARHSLARASQQALHGVAGQAVERGAGHEAAQAQEARELSAEDATDFAGERRADTHGQRVQREHEGDLHARRAPLVLGMLR